MLVAGVTTTTAVRYQQSTAGRLRPLIGKKGGLTVAAAACLGTRPKRCCRQAFSVKSWLSLGITLYKKNTKALGYL